MFAPLALLNILMASLLMLMAWGFWRDVSKRGNTAVRAGDELLWAMAALASLGLGMFVTFILIGFGR